jgi:sugar phosphate isomerase/epimerase
VDKTNTLVFNTTVAKHSTLMMELDIARSNGYSAIETTAAKVKSFLSAGHNEQDLKRTLEGFTIFGIGTIVDIERHGDDKASLISEAEEIFEIAALVGAKGVQVINGPLDFKAVEAHHRNEPVNGYRGVLGYDREHQVSITASNLARLADMAREFGILIYLEALAWSPLNKIRDQLDVLEAANRDNIKMVVDYWHCYTSGDTPDDVARIDRERIFGVHVCDALPFNGGVPNETQLRDVATGEGILNLPEWTDAVKHTGYDDWWSSETFCRKQQQQNSYEVTAKLKEQLEHLVNG